MTTHTDLAAQALAALKHMRMRWDMHDPTCNAAIAALESTERLAGGGELSWENSEGWESLAWELCADENGEDACNELVWEGGPVPEPWGERWLKYEDEAKRLIALVHKHVLAAPPPQAERVPLSDEQEDAARWRYLIKADCPTVCVMDDKTGEWLPIHPKNIQAVVDAERGIGSPKEST